MVELTQTKAFQKDFRRVRLKDHKFNRLIHGLECIRAGIALPPEYRDHSLSGKLADCREFHLSGDTLVLYRLVENQAQLIRLGSHNDLFNS